MTWRNLQCNPPQGNGIMVFRMAFAERSNYVYLIGTCDAWGEYRLYSMRDIGGKYVQFASNDLDDFMAEKRILRIECLELDEIL